MFATGPDWKHTAQISEKYSWKYFIQGYFHGLGSVLKEFLSQVGYLHHYNDVYHFREISATIDRF